MKTTTDKPIIIDIPEALSSHGCCPDCVDKFYPCK